MRCRARVAPAGAALVSGVTELALAEDKAVAYHAPCKGGSRGALKQANCSRIACEIIAPTYYRLTGRWPQSGHGHG